MWRACRAAAWPQRASGDLTRRAQIRAGAGRAGWPGRPGRCRRARAATPATPTMVSAAMTKDASGGVISPQAPQFRCAQHFRAPRFRHDAGTATMKINVLLAPWLVGIPFPYGRAVRAHGDDDSQRWGGARLGVVHRLAACCHPAPRQLAAHWQLAAAGSLLFLARRVRTVWARCVRACSLVG